MTTKTKDIIYFLSGIIVVAAAITHILNFPYATYAFAVGAVGIIYLRVTNLNSSENFRIRRLNKILAFSTILLIASGYLMFIKHNAWAVTLLLSAIFDLIVSYRMPKQQ